MEITFCYLRHVRVATYCMLLSSIDHFIKAEANTSMVDSALDCTSACFWGVCCYNRFSTFWSLIPKHFLLCLTQDTPNSQQTVQYSTIFVACLIHTAASIGRWKMGLKIKQPYALNPHLACIHQQYGPKIAGLLDPRDSVYCSNTRQINSVV
jgi:hypothetical protein